MQHARFLLTSWLIVTSLAPACSQEKVPPPEREAKRSPPTVAEKKKALSEEKLHEVRDLRDKLMEKVALLEKTSKQFDQEIENNVNEVRAETTKLSEETFDQAIQNRRIKAALEAIQKAQAYKGIVNRESQIAGEAAVETEGAEKQLRLDIIMLASVDEAKLDELLAKLDLVINKIQPQAKELVLKDAQTNLKPLEDIYKELVLTTDKGEGMPPPSAEDTESQKKMIIAVKTLMANEAAARSHLPSFKTEREEQCQKGSKVYTETYHCRAPYSTSAGETKRILCLLSKRTTAIISPNDKVLSCARLYNDKTEYCYRDKQPFLIKYAHCFDTLSSLLDKVGNQIQPDEQSFYCESIKEIKRISASEIPTDGKIYPCPATSHSPAAQDAKSSPPKKSRPTVPPKKITQKTLSPPQDETHDNTSPNNNTEPPIATQPPQDAPLPYHPKNESTLPDWATLKMERYELLKSCIEAMNSNDCELAYTRCVKSEYIMQEFSIIKRWVEVCRLKKYQ